MPMVVVVMPMMVVMVTVPAGEVANAGERRRGLGFSGHDEERQDR